MADKNKKQMTKLNPAKVKEMDRAKMGVALSGKLPDAEVEGQYLRAVYGDCPWCGTLLRIVDNTRWVEWYTCGACGGSFTC